MDLDRLTHPVNDASARRTGEALPSLVLLVEDDLDTLEALTEAIEGHGVRVVQAVDGNEALSALRDGIRPGVVFLDSWMPKLDGRSVLHALKADPVLAAIPVVWMSAEGGPPPSGTERLEKPIDIAHLVSILKSLGLSV